jgi:hypothetical protein
MVTVALDGAAEQIPLPPQRPFAELPLQRITQQ